MKDLNRSDKEKLWRSSSRDGRAVFGFGQGILPIAGHTNPCFSILDIPEAKTVEDYEKLTDFVLAEANL